jgi:RNA polymerase sigma factor (sigma-70 family)
MTSPNGSAQLDCSPERLMRLVRAGSGEALDQITRCYSQKLLAAGRRHCRTSDEAEDAVQDALLIAASQLTSLRDDASLEGWLVKVVASACRRLSRGQKNDASLHEAPANVLLVAGSNPEEQAAEHELARVLESALLALSPDERSILLLAELEGFSAAEIGAELKLTPGAVRTRLSRLRAGLIERLSSTFSKK